VAYRILQESLTNVLRHAGPEARATVRLCYEPAALGITVVDDGTGTAAGNGDEMGTGHGLAGMAERAAAVGGEVTAGPRGEGGFEGQRETAPCRGRRVIRVLLADDQALLRAGFRMLLEASEDICVVGEAANGGAAVAMAAELRPDVVLMDLRMPEVDGLTATKRISADPRLGGVKVVVLTTFDDDEHVFGALRAGASGFLVKDVEPEELLQAVRVVARGDALLAPSVTRSLIAAFTARTPGPRQRAGRAARGLSGGAPTARACRSPGPGHPHRPGARGGGAGRRGAVERRDRGAARGEPADREDPREPGNDQARRPGPGTARGARLRPRPRRSVLLIPRYRPPQGLTTPVSPCESTDVRIHGGEVALDHDHPVNPERVAAARAGVLSEGEAGRLAGLLGMLADPVRSRILFALVAGEELCVGDLALALDVTEDQVSYALKMLRLAGLVSFRKDGRMVFYRLSDGFPHPLLEHCLRQLLTIAAPEADR
jgi:DNA-binding NarL/FixJ family response regulator/DNA-binding transcriptional ArsR family regulator